MLLLAKVTLLFLVTLSALLASKRSAASIRHLLCFCALTGSLLLPITNLFPTHVIAVRVPLIDTIAVSSGVTQNATWSAYNLLLGLWTFGCFVSIVRLAAGHWRTRKLIRSATPTELADVSLFGVATSGIAMADVNVPVVCGLFRPMVLMPHSSAEWPAWQMEAAVRHERMHIQRGDLRTNLGRTPCLRSLVVSPSGLAALSLPARLPGNGMRRRSSVLRF
ncbi:MAG TPA: M56 family metallopeptidase [Bryobacteraceae bacterium]|jgi:beta-lactamase regulating signal transducer with metallopeptidase domain|nr:M56 family metallopeptidase [Bryobacteraceae bacterium]